MKDDGRQVFLPIPLLLVNCYAAADTLHKFTPFNSSGQGNYFRELDILIDILIEN